MSFSTHWNVNSARFAAIVILTLEGTCGFSMASATQPNPGFSQIEIQTDTHAELPGSSLLGQATMRYWGIGIYNARLWTLPSLRQSQTAEQPLILELEYLREFNGAAIAERSLKEMRRVGTITEVHAQKWLTEMKRMFPDVKSGDRLTGKHQPGQGASFWFNGRKIGQLDDPVFAALFFGIWLSPNTSEPDLRLALLGQNESDRRR